MPSQEYDLPNFRPLELSDKKWIDKFIFTENSKSADYNFGNLYMWDHLFRQRVAEVEGRLAIQPRYLPELYFAFPIGGGDAAPAIERLREYSLSNGTELCLRGVTAEHKRELETLFPEKFSFSLDRDSCDYIYLAQKLANLEGKKLHGKRNHINRFIEENDWHFEPLTKNLVPDCRAMLREWNMEKPAEDAEGSEDELTAIDCAFTHFEELGLEGGILFSKDSPMAFTIGEKIAKDTFDVHFEKAHAEINGAYPMVNREFVRQIISDHPEIEYINREDDMGKDNLRRAKLSYHPEFLVEKYCARWNAES